MRTKILLGTIFAAMLALGYAFVIHQPPAEASGPKNLRVLPGDTSMADLRNTMRGITRALGVQCDHCHDMDNMAKDTDKKKEARAMMRMTNAINQRHLQGSSSQVTCMTCHRGETTPNQ
jgi:hypothetical protein